MQENTWDSSGDDDDDDDDNDDNDENTADSEEEIISKVSIIPQDSLSR